MASAKWATPAARSPNLAGTTLDNLANGSESAVVTVNNATNRAYYAAVTIKLGSITPSAGGSITLRVTMSDGTDVSDRIGGDLYPAPVQSGTGAKVIIIPMVRLYPFSLRFSIINNTGVALAASGNEMYEIDYYEEVV